MTKKIAIILMLAPGCGTNAIADGGTDAFALFVESRASTASSDPGRARRKQASPARRSPRDAPSISSVRAA